MPLYYEADQDIAVVVPFIVDGEYVVPDVGSVKYTLRDNTGTPIPAVTNVDHVVGDKNFAVITIPAAHNGTGGIETSNRTLTVNYTVDMKPFVYRISYTLHSFFNITVTKDDCRAAVGMDADQMPDGDIDLVWAYLSLTSANSNLAAKFTAGGLASLNANNSVKYAACLEAMPAIRRRALKRQVTDGVTAEKADIDFDKLEADLQAKLSGAIRAALGTISIQPTYLVIGSRTDELTGE